MWCLNLSQPQVSLKPLPSQIGVVTTFLLTATGSRNPAGFKGENIPSLQFGQLLKLYVRILCSYLRENLEPEGSLSCVAQPIETHQSLYQTLFASRNDGKFCERRLSPLILFDGWDRPLYNSRSTGWFQSPRVGKQKMAFVTALVLMVCSSVVFSVPFVH